MSYNFQKNRIILLLILFAMIGNNVKLIASDKVNVVKIYSEVNYEVLDVKSGWWDKTINVKSIYIGTGFRIGDYIVTAKHVLTGPQKDSIKEINGQKIGKEDKFLSRSLRIRLSALSYEPQELFLHPTKDIAFIKIKETQLSALKMVKYDIGDIPSVDDEVTVWGFPGTSAPQKQTSSDKGGTLTVCGAYGSYFTVNSPLEPGYSGGLVVKNDVPFLGSEAVGVVSRSEDKQARIITIPDVSPKSFKPYKDGVTITELKKDKGL